MERLYAEWEKASKKECYERFWPALVADDFGYVYLDKGKRKLVNVVDTFQAQHRDKSRATP